MPDYIEVELDDFELEYLKQFSMLNNISIEESAVLLVENGIYTMISGIYNNGESTETKSKKELH